MILKRLQVKTAQEGLVTNTYIICDEKTKETKFINSNNYNIGININSYGSVNYI